MWGFTPEEVQAMVAASNGITSPVLVHEEIVCDTCKEPVHSLETAVQCGGETCHITEKCLPVFAEKHNWASLNVCKKVQLISDGEI